MRKSLRSRGFTLIELLVGAAVGALVLVGISLTFISQARQYQAHANRRGLQANARQAMSFMERRLRDAGYGVDPDRAVIAYDSFDAVTNSSQPGYPDAFIVHWRDPLFRRTATSATAAAIVLPGASGRELRRGQILLVICSPATGGGLSDAITNAQPPHAFVTVAQWLPDTAVNIPLDQTAAGAAPNSPLGMPGRLFHEQASLTHPCFTSVTSPPQVVLVNRAAFYVAAFDDGRGARVPYLMMHQGLDQPAPGNAQGDGVIDALDAVPVASSIEQLQVAYILDTNDEDDPTPPILSNYRFADNSPIVRGVEADMDNLHYGENWEQNPVDSDVSGVGPLPTGWVFNPFTAPPAPVRRYTNTKLFFRDRLLDHPANIRQVRLTLVSRSAVPDPQLDGDNLLTRQGGAAYPDGPALPGNNGRAWRHLENLGNAPANDFRPANGGFYRFILRQTVAPKNLLMTRQFVPVNMNTPLGGG